MERDTAGNPAGGLAQDKTSVTSFGLWVNAIPGSEAIGEDGMVSGTIIYDKITAVSAGVTEAVFEEVKSGDPGTEEPGTDTPGTEEPGTDEPGTEEPGTDIPGTEEPGTETPGTGNDGKGDPVQTGDDTNCMPYAAAALAAGAAAVGTVVYRRKIRH